MRNYFSRKINNQRFTEKEWLMVRRQSSWGNIFGHFVPIIKINYLEHVRWIYLIFSAPSYFQFKWENEKCKNFFFKCLINYAKVWAGLFNLFFFSMNVEGCVNFVLLLRNIFTQGKFLMLCKMFSELTCFFLKVK